MNMLLPLSLCFALMMLTCCENQEEATTSDYDYVTETATTPVRSLWRSLSPQTSNNFQLSVVQRVSVFDLCLTPQTAGIGPFSFLLLLGLAVHQLWT
ncbi:uncharacterized protein V6R79_007518 [Siganus canaliculatus]